MSDHGHDDIAKHVKFYQRIYYVLLVLTVVTVWVSQFHLGVSLAITLALVVASTKGFLVANYFMHLSSEKRGVYQILLLTAVLFTFLMGIPVWTNNDKVTTEGGSKALGYDYVP